MYAFKEILRFNLRRMLGNIWLWLAVLASTLFILVFGADKLIGEQSGLQFVIGFNHVNMVFPLVVLGYCVWFINEVVHGKITELLDSYSYRNRQMFFGVYTGLFVTFWLLATVQFLIAYLFKALFYSSLSQPGLGSILWFSAFSFFNVLLLVSLATLVGVIFNETLFGYISVFFYQVLNLLFDKFSPRYLRWFSLMHTNIYKYDNYSVFARLGIETRLFVINRLGVLALSVVAIVFARTLFKRYREKKKRHLVFILLGSIAFLSLCLIAFDRVNGAPVKATANLVAQAKFDHIPLDMGPFDIKGVHKGDRIDLSALFMVRNITEETVPLKFYLARNFSLKNLYCDDKEVTFDRDGDLVATSETIAPGNGLFCRIEYGGTMCEYVKTADFFWDYTHKLYAYIGPELIFVPGCAGWYPSPRPIFNYVPPLQWIYPSREQNRQNVSLCLKGNFPIVAHQNIIYGYPNLVCSILDGIEYYHSREHGKSVERFHQIVAERLFLLQELIPNIGIQVFEVPQNQAIADLMIENGFGRIMISEETIVKAASYEEDPDYHLERVLFSGWFNLSNLGFESYSPSSYQGGVMFSYLPGLSFGSPDAFILFDCFQYIFQAENDPSFDTQAREGYLSQRKSQMRDVEDRFKVLEKSIAYYEKYGLPGAKKIFTYSFKLEQNNSLTRERLAEYLEGEG